MNNSTLYKAFVFALFSVIFAVVAIISAGKRYSSAPIGRLLWANTDSNPPLTKIIIKKPQKNITLELEENLWRVIEADYYYASSDLISKLLTDFKTSQIFRTVDNIDPSITRLDTIVETYSDNKLLDKITIGAALPDHRFHYARRGDSALYQVSGDYVLPDETFAWLLQPLLSYPLELIETVEMVDAQQNFSVSRPDSNASFYKPDHSAANLSALLERFNFLIAEDVKSVQNFDETGFKNAKQIKLRTFSGLWTDVKLYYNTPDSCWLKISLSVATLSTTGVNDYIRDNRFRYEGWYFKIPAADAKVLVNFKI